MSDTRLLSATGLSVRYNGTAVLDSVSLDADVGGFIGLIGPNGAGKTTLIKVLAGLIKPNQGDVVLEGKPLHRWQRGALAQAIGYLSQSRVVHWPVTVERLVSLGRLPHLGPWDSLGQDDVAAVERAMAQTDVAHLRQRTVTTLSGGELARVLLARVLACEPWVLLADEPVSGLDPGHRFQVLDGLKTMAKAGKLVIAVMHDLTLASRYCDRLVLLHDGHVVADGDPDSVLSSENLTNVYGVEAARLSLGENDAVVPWRLT